MLLVRPQ